MKKHSFLMMMPVFLAMLSTIAQAQSSSEGELDDIMFSENWFSDLDKAKQQPEKVRYLDLSLKKLKTFPPEIFQFKNIERLYLPYNYWSSIPDEIGTLTKLKIFDISGNYYLNFLPKEGLSKLPNFEQLIVKDNKLSAGEITQIRKLMPKVKVVTE